MSERSKLKGAVKTQSEPPGIPSSGMSVSTSSRGLRASRLKLVFAFVSVEEPRRSTAQRVATVGGLVKRARPSTPGSHTHRNAG